MAATAHSDPYSILMRKVGYSVGLEYTSQRVEDLACKYLREKDITAASWHQLVKGKKELGNWGLLPSGNAEKHIGDFFFSLRLIQLIPGDVLVLENLDAIAIASELLGDVEQERKVRDFLLLWAILVNDGEVFVNLLLAGFEDQAIREKLETMISNKRRRVVEKAKGKIDAQRVNQIINIERQENNRGSAGAGHSVIALKRTQPLQTSRGPSLKTNDDNIIDFSQDYFRKVPPRRREWAISLGLWDDADGLTQRGGGFIESLRRSGYIDAMNTFTYWPMDYELVRSGFRLELFEEKPKSLWACLLDFGKAYAQLHYRPYLECDSEIAVRVIDQMLEKFRGLHARKAMLRRELPITIAYPAFVAMCCARGEPVLDLPFAIAEEQKNRRRITLRRSRNTGAALSMGK